jgi:hypothetical protein
LAFDLRKKSINKITGNMQRRGQTGYLKKCLRANEEKI